MCIRPPNRTGTTAPYMILTIRAVVVLVLTLHPTPLHYTQHRIIYDTVDTPIAAAVLHGHSSMRFYRTVYDTVVTLK